MKYRSQLARFRWLMVGFRQATLDHVRPPWLGPRVKRIFERLGPVGWVILLALGIPLAGAALADPVSDKTVAEQIIASMPAASDSSMQSVVRAPVDEAKRA